MPPYYYLFGAGLCVTAPLFGYCALRGAKSRAPHRTPLLAELWHPDW